jgi:hypothetical protein
MLMGGATEICDVGGVEVDTRASRIWGSRGCGICIHGIPSGGTVTMTSPKNGIGKDNGRPAKSSFRTDNQLDFLLQIDPRSHGEARCCDRVCRDIRIERVDQSADFVEHGMVEVFVFGGSGCEVSKPFLPGILWYMRKGRGTDFRSVVLGKGLVCLSCPWAHLLSLEPVQGHALLMQLQPI